MDWLRLGNQAYQRGDYQAALEHYARAMPLTTDPGQVAFQQGTAHAAMAADEEAALAFQRALEDAQGPRRVLALYGRGNALAQAGNRRQGRAAVALLRQALRCYEDSLAAFRQLSPPEQARCPRLEENLTHNLNIVRSVLSVKEQEAAAQPEETPPEDPKKNDAPEQSDPAPGDKNSPRPETENGTGDTPRTTDKTAPGKGQLPLLLDDKNAPPLTPEQAEEHLRHTMERLQQQRGQGHGAIKPGARDW